MLLKVYDPQKKRDVIIGEIVDGNFVKKVDSKKHFMLRVNGYGIQEMAMPKLRELNVRNVVIKEQDTGEEWIAALGDWMSRGKVANYGAGAQRFLSIKYMVNGRTLREAAKQGRLL